MILQPTRTGRSCDDYALLFSFSLKGRAMSATRNDGWGEMVLPGVFMLRGKTSTSRLADYDPYSGEVDIILHRIEQLEKYIEKINQSNALIGEYLREENCGTTDTQSVLSGMEVGTLDGDNDDSVFLEALAENNAILSMKMRELNELKSMVQSSHCLSHYHHDSSITTEHMSREQSAEITPEEDENISVNNMSNIQFSL
uniref:Uncharacterized protein n=1 Tax=Trypanosoma congolense (strain IL3000) TaxID=1068625 RepID=G0UJJ1_TRYCI|nr:conserved hypothetical protein [Trypanosoma congolense IL3000]